nr:hypothetical protein [uncultured Tyzzerella sp.]
MEITYFPTQNYNINDECNHILTQLYNNLFMLDFEKGFIKAENMEGFIQEGIVKFFVEYNFYVFKKQQSEKMQNLFI